MAFCIWLLPLTQIGTACHPAVPRTFSKKLGAHRPQRRVRLHAGLPRDDPAVTRAVLAGKRLGPVASAVVELAARMSTPPSIQGPCASCKMRRGAEGSVEPTVSNLIPVQSHTQWPGHQRTPGLLHGTARAIDQPTPRPSSRRTTICPSSTASWKVSASQPGLQSKEASQTYHCVLTQSLPTVR